MMDVPSYFNDFLSNIRPTANQRDDARTGHRTLRKRLHADEELAPIIVSTFIQGSYRRATAIRPREGKRSDVDVIVVTTLDRTKVSPGDAMKRFVPFLNEHYKGKWRFQGRSIGIELSYVDLDLVITSAPSEVDQRALKAASVLSDDTPDDTDDWRLVESWVPMDERGSTMAPLLLKRAAGEAEWKLEPLWIPDRDVGKWERTHPLAQIAWTWAKNRACKRHYVNVVKALKWWRRVNHPKPEHPKGYPLEHLIGQSSADGMASVGVGVTFALETIAQKYQAYAAAKLVPSLPDHGVPEHNVMKRITGEDFAAFHAQACDASKIARRALDAETISESVRAWRELFGSEFPPPPDGDDEGDDGPDRGGYTPRKNVSVIGGGRFA